jgi:hypothetical protein
MKSKRTFNDGATTERSAILRYLKNLARAESDNTFLFSIISWIKGRKVRFNKRVGGVGRK